MDYYAISSHHRQTRGFLLCIGAVASRRLRGRGEGTFEVCLNAFQLAVTHISLKNLIFSSRSLPPLPLFLENFKRDGQKAAKQAYFSPFLTGNLQEQSEKRPVFFIIKLSPNTLLFSFHPLDTPQTESRTHRTPSLNPTHQGPENRLYYEGFFLIYLKKGAGEMFLRK